MRVVGALLLFGIIVALLFVIIGLIMKLDSEKNKKLIERVVETQEVTEYFEYLQGMALNEKLWTIISSDGYKQVVTFFNKYTKNAEISVALTEESMNQGVPITQAFGMAWGESRFNPRGIKRNYVNGKLVSTDRGVMGLNDAHRKNWTEADFFNIRKNVKEGVAYLKQSLDEYGGHYILGVSGYNAGIYTIPDGIQFLTLKYASDVDEFERGLEIDLNYFVNRWKESPNATQSTNK